MAVFREASILVVGACAMTASTAGCTFTSEVCDISAEYCDEPYCGDGTLDPGEECEDSVDPGCEGCRLACGGDDLFDPATRHCYRVLFDELPRQWLEAVLACDEVGGERAHLAVVSTGDEYDLFMPWMLERAGEEVYVWMGGVGENETYEGEKWLRFHNGDYTFGEGDTGITYPCVAWYHDEMHLEFVGHDCALPQSLAVYELVPADG